MNYIQQKENKKKTRKEKNINNQTSLLYNPGLIVQRRGLLVNKNNKKIFLPCYFLMAKECSKMLLSTGCSIL
jgi:hypothetical protein